MTTVGIIGVGFLGGCLAEGLAEGLSGGPAKPATSLILSPRNAERAARLAAAYGCIVAKDNAEVVERADVVLLSTRPGDIAATAEGLPWRSGQRAISIAAGVRLASVQSAVSPATAVRAMPISASRLRSSPTAFCPDDPVAAEILGRIGTAHPFPDEERFETASIFGAFYALVFAFVDEASNWAETNGLEPETARNLAARMVQAAATGIVADNGRAPRELLNDLMTPGGITEEGLKVLENANAFTPWSDALDASFAKARSIDSKK